MIFRNLHIIFFCLAIGNFSYAQHKPNKSHVEENSKSISTENKDKSENKYESSASSDNEFETVTIDNGNLINSDRSQIQQSKHGEVSAVKNNSKVKLFFSRIWNTIDLYCKRNDFSKKKLYNLLIGNLY